MIKSGVYKITNTDNGKIYVGSSVNLSARKAEHLRTLRRNCHDNQHLQRSFNIHGEQAFKFSVLEYVEDKNKLLEREQYYIDTLNACEKSIGYNICKTAGNCLGRPCKQETRKALSKANKGKKRSNEFCRDCAERASGKRNPFFGKHRSEETKKKISDALKGRKAKPLTEEHRKKISKSLRGRKRRPLTINEKCSISEGLKKYFSEHRCANSKRVRNIDTGEIYESVTEAERILNLHLRHSHIGDVCRGKRKIAYGYKWEYC
jgi:group I intron endonuclease